MRIRGEERGLLCVCVAGWRPLSWASRLSSSPPLSLLVEDGGHILRLGGRQLLPWEMDLGTPLVSPAPSALRLRSPSRPRVLGPEPWALSGASLHHLYLGDQEELSRGFCLPHGCGLAHGKHLVT